MQSLNRIYISSFFSIDKNLSDGKQELSKKNHGNTYPPIRDRYLGSFIIKCAFSTSDFKNCKFLNHSVPQIALRVLRASLLQMLVFMRVFTYILLILLFGNQIFSQVPSNPIGNNAASLKWDQINTDQVRIIFPRGLDSYGNRVANVVKSLWEMEQETIGSKKKKVSIVLHPQTVLSNAFVTVAPYRSEFFVMPKQFDCSTDFIDQLAIHEYRHIQQFNNSKQGITGLIGSVLGDWAWGGALGLAVPRWYFEGDATIAETVHSASGRGRLPLFNHEYNSLFESGIQYNYEKAGAGSFKDYVPNWYNLGYQILSYGRDEYGPSLWKDVTKDAVRYKGILYPFARSLKKRTGKNPRMMYESSMQKLKLDYEAVKEAQKYSDHSMDFVTKQKHTVINYSSAHFLNDNLLIAQKDGYDQIDQLVKIDQYGTEQNLVAPGFILESPLSSISVSKGIICWAELGWDIRRRYKRFSEIVSYDSTTGIKKRLTKKSYYFSPALSADARKIAAIHYDPNLLPELHILDASSGNVLHKFEIDREVSISFPQWLDDNSIVFIGKKNQLFSIYKLNLRSGNIESITGGTNDQMAHLHVDGQRLFHSRTFNNSSNIFVHDLSTGEDFQVTHTILGAYQPSVSPNSKQLVYSAFSNTGYELKKIDLNPKDWVQRKSFKSTRSQLYLTKLLDQENRKFLKNVSTDSFEVKGFNRWTGIIKPHSLLANFSDTDAEVTLLSDNIFSTLSADLTASFNFNEEEWSYSAGVTYAELFPVIDVRYTRANRAALYFNYQFLSDTSFVQTIFFESWNENRIRAGVTIPLNFSKGNQLNSVALLANFSRITTDSDNLFLDSDTNSSDTILFSQNNFEAINQIVSEPFQDMSFNALDLILSARSTKITALQHLNPRFGATVLLRYRKPFTNDIIGGDQFFARGRIFLPGMKQNHSFHMGFYFQKERLLDNYRFSDNFNYPRGYDLSLRRDRFMRFSFDYEFPLWYPDVPVGGLAFIKRVKANPFFDLGLMSLDSFPFTPRTNQMKSVGVEIGFDVRVLRLLEVDFGVRYSYLLDEIFIPNGQRHQFDFFVISITE